MNAALLIKCLLEYLVETKNLFTEMFCILFRFVLGMITLGNLMARIVAGKVTPETPLSECIYSKFKKVFIFCLFDIF